MVKKERAHRPRRMADRLLIDAVAEEESCLLWIAGRWADVPMQVRQIARTCASNAAKALIASGYRREQGPLIGAQRAGRRRR